MINIETEYDFSEISGIGKDWSTQIMYIIYIIIFIIK